MINNNLLSNSPAWLIFSGATILMLIGNYYGYRLGLWHRKRNPEAVDSSNGELMGAIFGVLGFTLAFLFGMSLTRLEHKKELVLSEASAILAAYQQTQFLPEPYKTRTGKLVTDYAKLRVSIIQRIRENKDPKQLREGIFRSERIQDSLLKEGLALKKEGSDDASSFLGAVSNIVDLNMRRINNSTYDRIPRSLKILMYVMALMGLAGMGYGSGLKGGRSLLPNILLVIVFAIIIGIIIDMDQPTNTLFNVSQQPVQDVIRRIEAMHF